MARSRAELTSERANLRLCEPTHDCNAGLANGLSCHSTLMIIPDPNGVPPQAGTSALVSCKNKIECVTLKQEICLAWLFTYM